ncbi:MAG: hypothetical protein M0R33_18700 [Methylomonas sp.]|jgi:allophanate hydrolase subunit 1|uniref:hypothetical protein n=1 Tax=Methylomonas sp. TaxID=418 RepID=UPI0025E9D7F8|nr:hypothetical protein [Methylomonas sp.]MCK9608474.1 hypothetical protein [Methylomonas sp.]
MKAVKIQANPSHPTQLLAQDRLDHSNNDGLSEQFPSSRYFQVHFQHIHENADALHKELKQLKQYVAALDAKLDRVLALLLSSPKQNS